MYPKGLKELGLDLNTTKSKLWAPHHSEAEGTEIAKKMHATLVHDFKVVGAAVALQDP